MMNLKSYLRGLGIGVVVTALIMGITTGRKKEVLSNEEIKERARALGMIEESQVLADMLGDEDGEGDVNGQDLASDAMSPSIAEPSPEGEADLASARDTLSDTPENSESETDEPADNGADMPENSTGQEDEAENPEDESGEDSAEDSESSGEAESRTDSQEETGRREDAPDNGAGVIDGGSVTIEILSGEGSFIVCQKLEDAGAVPLASEFDRYLYENGYDKRINTGTYKIPAGAGFEEIARIIAKMN